MEIEPLEILSNSASSSSECDQTLKLEINRLKTLLSKEQLEIALVKQQLHESESRRLELISNGNKETFQLNSDLARIRKDLEKSEALRQVLESELASIKSYLGKEKFMSQEKERILQENTRFFEGLNQIKLF